MSERILFLVNGLGLGNSTRCHAVIQRLQESGAEIEVVTSGNGLWYFSECKDIPKVHEISTLYYGKQDGKLSVFQTMLQTANFARIMRRNSQKVASILDRFKPHTVVCDSVYTLGPMRSKKIPVAALNNADVVHYAYRRFIDRPKSIRAQFYLIEEADYLFHRFKVDLVVSPIIDPTVPCPNQRVVHVGPIVRKGHRTALQESKPKKIVIMLSGSTFGTPVTLTKNDHPVRIDILGRPKPEGWKGHPRVHYHGRCRDTVLVLSDADLVIANGGFSAVSELFCMNKPMLVAPVPNHAEQWVNARTIKQLGVGNIIDEASIENAIGPALEHIDKYRAAYSRLAPPPDGAAQAAEAILSLARRYRV